MLREWHRKVYKFIRLLRNHRYRRALWQGVAAAVEHREVLSELRCATVVDIGANRGQFALVSHECCPSAKIFSFEPLNEPATVFDRLFKDSQRIKLFRYAIGRQAGDAPMYLSHSDDSSSLLPITDLQNEIFPGTGLKEIRSVAVARLDELINWDDLIKPALLKIDVQGFELEVLYGCDSLLGNFQYVYVECSFMELYEGQASANDVVRFLHERNYALNGIHNLVYDNAGRSVQGDILFENGATE